MKTLVLLVMVSTLSSAQVINFGVKAGSPLPAWVYKATGTLQLVDSLGHTTTYTARISVTSDIPAEKRPIFFELNQNYPNPFNPSTTIEYSMAARARVELTIYDVLGQPIETLVDQVQDVGNYSVRWDGTAFASGVYYCRLKAGDFMQTRKILLMR